MVRLWRVWTDGWVYGLSFAPVFHLATGVGECERAVSSIFVGSVDNLPLSEPPPNSQNVTVTLGFVSLSEEST